MAYIDGLCNIPEAMRRYNQWMLTDKNKAPLSYDWGEGRIYQGSKNNPDQWLSFSDACRLAEELGLFIGFCPTKNDPFTIIDLDHKDGKVYDADAETIKNGLYAHAAATTYVETSLSGRGAHIVVEGKLENDFNSQSAGIECYGNLGFVLMTGRIVSVSNNISNQQSSLDWLASRYPNAVSEAKVNGLQLNWDQINNASPEEKALDDQFAEWVNKWETHDRVDGWLNYQGEDMSGPDMKVMQLFVKFTRDRAYPDESAIRMFLRSPRAKFLNRKPDPQQYVLRTLLQAKQYIAADEQRLKDFDFGEGTRKLLDQYMAQMTQPTQAPALPANSAVAPNLAPQPPAFSGFSWLTADDLEQQPALEWLLRGLWPTRGMGAVYGEPGSGKSFLIVDMVAAIAEGLRWFGLKTRQVPVSIFALEGEGGLKGRKQAWEKANNRSYPQSVFFWDSVRNGNFALRDGDGRSTVNRERLVQVCADLKAKGRTGGLIVIDTLNQASDGADENSARDMGELIRAIKFLSQETQSFVLIVHHSTKGEQKTLRGHSSLSGAMDGIMEVKRGDRNLGGEEVRKWIAVKVKDGRDGIEREFKLVEQQIGFDEEGPLTSTAVRQVDMIDPETGEAVNGGSAPAPMVSGGNGAYVASRNKPTWSQGERANGGASRETRPPRSAKENVEREGRNGSNHKAVIDAIVAESVKTAGANIGKFGAPQGAHCAPRDAVLETAVQIRNAPDPKQSKKNLHAAINTMIEQGKIGSQMAERGQQWLWVNSL